MMNKIFSILSGDFPASHFIRLGDNNKLNLYVGRDENLRYAFDFRGRFSPNRIVGSDVIDVAQFKDGDDYYLRFSLENPDLLEYFCTFCADLIDSTNIIGDDTTAYSTLRSRYFSWRSLFKPNHGNLSEIEVMGLVGELLFLHDVMVPSKGIDVALDSWTGPEKTHKDFSLDNEWYEVKTINFGKESVHISSIEQLDSDLPGVLAIYSLEKMSPAYNGIKLNTLVNDFISCLKSTTQKELFMAKLGLYGFDFSPENDNYVFAIKYLTQYCVDVEKFPRVSRSMLPESIIKVQYDILLSDMESFKISQTN